MDKIVDIDMDNDKEVAQIKIEWLELGLESWYPFNFDTYEDLEDYKKQLKRKLKKMKNLSDKKKKTSKIQDKKEMSEYIQELKEEFKKKFKEEYTPFKF